MAKIKLTEKEIREVYQAAGYELQENKYPFIKSITFKSKQYGSCTHQNYREAEKWIEKIISCNPGYFLKAENILHTLLGNQFKMAKVVDPNSGV